MEIRKVLTDVGMSLIIPGLMAILSIPVCIIFREYDVIPGFILTLIPSLAIGLPCFYARSKRSFHIFEMVMIISLSWFCVTVICTIPFLFQGIKFGHQAASSEDMVRFSALINSFFESVSGFTSTGLTMVQDEPSLTHSIQWWRSFMQWVGGIGIIVMVTFFHNPRLYSDDSYYEKDDFADVVPNPNVHFRNYWWIYLMFTGLAIGIFLVNGMPVWEAVNHGMTGIATGGFTITDNSFAGYSGLLRISAVFIMILGSLNFNLFHRLFTRGEFRKFFLNTQIIVFFGLFLSGAVVISLLNQVDDIGIIDSVFQYSSALTTSGFQSSAVNLWKLVPVLMLSAVMMIGGTTDSTTGGIKIFRFWIFLKSIFINSSRVLFHPKKPLKIYLQEKKFNDPKRNKDLLIDTYIYLLLWLFVYAFGTILLAWLLQDKFDLKDIIFEASSAFGNVGLTSGITGPEMAFPAKLLIILIMFAGRLELMPLMILLGLAFRKKEE